MLSNKILIIAAHPDDEVLGCAGTIARLIQQGYEAYIVILGEGITSRDKDRNAKQRKNDLNTLKKQIYNANELLGIKEIFTFDLPDNRFDSVDLLDIIKIIEEVKNKTKPEIIFTHSKYDLNIDHQITYKAVITATRPMQNESVKTIYSFEILSSTEWNYPLKFSPNIYFDITSTIDKKIDAMKIYESELKEYPHPRSLQGIKVKAKQRGMEVGVKYAEAFELVRQLL